MTKKLIFSPRVAVELREIGAVDSTATNEELVGARFMSPCICLRVDAIDPDSKITK